jgi:hypothetical protein
MPAEPRHRICEVGALCLVERTKVIKITRCLQPLLQRLGLLVVLALVLIGCGSSLTTPVVTSAAVAATPTPVPTSAPLLLPPADDTLPALAPLPASVATSALATEATATLPTIAEDGGPVSAAASRTASEATDDSATEVAPISEQDALPASAVAVVSTESTASIGDGILSIGSAGRWNDCVVLEAERTGATALLGPIAGGVALDMSSVQLNSLAAASVSCDMVTVGLADTAVGDYLATATTCMNAWLESSGGGSVFVGLASIGWSQPTPSWAQPHLVDALDGCFTGASFAADVMSVVSTDSALNSAFDAGCLATSFDSSGTMRSYAHALASAPMTAVLSVSLGDTWVLNCANVGQMVAAAAAADGVALSSPTISCIDSELNNTGAIAQLVAGTADTNAVGIATIACLTDSEATALFG